MLFRYGLVCSVQATWGRPRGSRGGSWGTPLATQQFLPQPHLFPGRQHLRVARLAHPADSGTGLSSASSFPSPPRTGDPPARPAPSPHSAHEGQANVPSPHVPWGLHSPPSLPHTWHLTLQSPPQAACSNSFHLWPLATAPRNVHVLAPGFHLKDFLLAPPDTRPWGL